jgi:membrane-associated phospholipid phosphatase
MLLVLAVALLLAGVFALRIDRKTAAVFREHLHDPLFRFALKMTDWAKGGPWIGASLLFYIGAQATIALGGETDRLHLFSDYALALLASFVVGSVVLHTIKIFLGRRRPRDDFEHGLYGFRYFTWQLQYDSFPSGHAMTIFSVAVMLTAAMPMLTAVWLALAGALALTRALLTAHFLSDVLVGAAVGIVATRETFVFLFPNLVPGWPDLATSWF